LSTDAMPGGSGGSLCPRPLRRACLPSWSGP
jgi:hypothetical protein